MIKCKVDKYIQELKKHNGAEVDALDRFNSLIQRTQDGDVKILLHSNIIEVIFIGDEDIYLDIHSDNTVACSEDEYGKFMYFKVDVFNMLMEL